MAKPFRIAVIGGGISGLVLTHHLLELKARAGASFEVTLFEAANRLGGTIETEKKDGFILEKGPDSFISEKPWALDLCKKIGLEPEVIGTRNENRKSFVVRHERLLEIPPGFYLVAPTQIGAFLKSGVFSLGGKFRMMCEPFVRRAPGDEDESVGSFIRRRFGQECLDRVGQPMIAGIYTGDPDKLSMFATMPRFKELEKEYGSVIRGLLVKASNKKGGFKAASGPRYSLFLSFRDGMETLTNKLAEKIPARSIRLNCGIKEITHEPQSAQWRLSTTSGETRVFDAVCSTVSSKITGNLIRKTKKDLSQELDKIPYESVATINFAFRRQDIRHPLDGFGFVVPRSEHSALVACSFSSQKFDHRVPKDTALLRVFLGGVFGRDVYQKEDKALAASALGELSKLLGISAKPILTSLGRYPEAMAQYQTNHLNLVSVIEDKLKTLDGLFLAGTSYRGVGISDCVRDSQAQAERIFRLGQSSA